MNTEERFALIKQRTDYWRANKEHCAPAGQTPDGRYQIVELQAEGPVPGIPAELVGQMSKLPLEQQVSHYVVEEIVVSGKPTEGGGFDGGHVTQEQHPLASYAAANKLLVKDGVIVGVGTSTQNGDILTLKGMIWDVSFGMDPEGGTREVNARLLIEGDEEAEI